MSPSADIAIVPPRSPAFWPSAAALALAPGRRVLFGSAQVPKYCRLLAAPGFGSRRVLALEDADYQSRNFASGPWHEIGEQIDKATSGHDLLARACTDQPILPVSTGRVDRCGERDAACMGASSGMLEAKEFGMRK